MPINSLSKLTQSFALKSGDIDTLAFNTIVTMALNGAMIKKNPRKIEAIPELGYEFKVDLDSKKAEWCHVGFVNGRFSVDLVKCFVKIMTRPKRCNNEIERVQHAESIILDAKEKLKAITDVSFAIAMASEKYGLDIQVTLAMYQQLEALSRLSKYYLSRTMSSHQYYLSRASAMTKGVLYNTVLECKNAEKFIPLQQKIYERKVLEYTGN